MPSKEIYGLRAAADIAKVSPEAMREWCERYPIARREGRKWVINRRALMKVVNAYAFVGVRRKAASK